MKLLEQRIGSIDALIIGDYEKGIVTQPLLDWLKETCRAHGVWLSMDPKPAHLLDLSGVSLLTPNRKEAFELAGISDTSRCNDPLKDEELDQRGGDAPRYHFTYRAADHSGRAWHASL